MAETFESARASARERGSGADLEQLRALAEAAWWAGDGTTSMALGEEVYRRLEAEGLHEAAALQALDLSLEWVTRGDEVVGTAWLGRARHIVDRLDGADGAEGPHGTGATGGTVAHGFVRYAEAAFELDADADPVPARDAAAEVAALGRLHPDSPLPCFSRVLEGLADVRAGRTTEGFRALDDAMLEVLDGRVPPRWSGDIYCSTIHLAHVLADWGRMRAWTDALDRWASPLSRTFLYATVTRVHHLQLVSSEGGWDEVLARMGDFSATLVGSHGWLAGEGFMELGDILRCRGQVEEAAAAYSQARELGVEPQPGEALLAHGGGRSAEAARMLRAVMSGKGPLERSRLLLPAVEVGVASGDDDLACSAAEELHRTATRYGTPGLAAWADHARGLVARAQNEPEVAITSLESALGAYREQRCRYAVARVHEHLASARRTAGQDRAADADAATALSIYRELRARPDIARLSSLTRPGGLTEREVEVLGLVVLGASNREIADGLVISEKTVSRHLANIFTKVGVGSRTAAAAWAHAHGIHGSPHIPR